MAERKKRGLGRGLGALIPDANSSDRPVDVFFSGGDSEQSKDAETEAKSPRAARNDPAASMQSSRRRKPKSGAAAKSSETKEAASKVTATKASGSKAAKPAAKQTAAKSAAGAKDSAGTKNTVGAKASADTKTAASSKTASGTRPVAGAKTAANTKAAESKSGSGAAGNAKNTPSSTTTRKSTSKAEPARKTGTATKTGTAPKAERAAKSEPATKTTPTTKSAGTTASSASKASGSRITESEKSAAGATTASPNVSVSQSSDDVLETHPGVYTSSGAAALDESSGHDNDSEDTTNVVASSAGPPQSNESSVTDEASAETAYETPTPAEHNSAGTEASDGGADEDPSDDSGSGELDGVESIPDTEFGEIDVELIDANPRQPRTVFDEDMLAELVHSIREIGVLQPVVVRQKPSDPGRFELIMGERRLRATKDAGLSSIPAIIRYVEDTDLLRDALLENLHRAELNPLEEAAAYGQLLEDFGCTQEELSERIGRSRPQISNTLRLLRLPPLVQRRVAAGVISAGHARAILGLRDAEHMEVLAQRIVAEGLSVRASEEAVVLLNRGDSVNVSRATSKVSPEFLEVAERLGDRLDTKVNITVGKRKGKLSVEFANQEDLDRILTLLGISQAEE